MNIVAIETATSACAIGLRTSEREETRVLDLERRHTEVLTPGIAALLDECALTARDLDRVVIDVGPGLFTGLRVGVATAIGLAEGLGCDLVSVTSLELLARGAALAGERGTVLARKVVIEWATNARPVTFTGDGVERYLRDFAAVPTARVFDQHVPSLEAALALGATREPTTKVTPLYLREADAIANFTTRERS